MRGPVSGALIRSHIWQINDLLVGTHWMIVAVPRCGTYARWFLRRRPREAAERPTVAGRRLITGTESTIEE